MRAMILQGPKQRIWCVVVKQPVLRHRSCAYLLAHQTRFTPLVPKLTLLSSPNLLPYNLEAACGLPHSSSTHTYSQRHSELS